MILAWRVWMARASLEAALSRRSKLEITRLRNAPSTRSYGGTYARSIPSPSSTVRASAAIVATPGSCLASLPAASAAGRTGDDQVKHAAHFASPAPLLVLTRPRACGRVQTRAMIGPEALPARGSRRALSSIPLPLEPDLAGKPTRWKPWPRARWPRRTLTPAPDRAAAAGGRCPPEPASRRRTQARTYERTAAGTYVPGSQRQATVEERSVRHEHIYGQQIK
jgi:hypothetical protein